MSDFLMALLGAIHDQITGEGGYETGREYSPGGTIQGSSECTYENEYALDDNLAEISDAWFARHPELLPPPKG